jgi:xanthine/uracil permease
MTVPSDPPSPIQPGTPAQPAGRPERPTTVTLAGYLLIGIAVLQVIGLITALASYPTIRDVFTEAYKGTAMADSAGVIAAVSLVTGILGVLLFGGGAAVLAPLVLKGKQAARIITWVLTGLVVCCQGGTLASSGVNTASFSQGSNTNGVDMAKLQQQLTDSLPSWVHPVELATGGLLVVLAIAVIILLALPASHPYFRKQPEQWAPPSYPTV